MSYLRRLLPFWGPADAASPADHGRLAGVESERAAAHAELNERLDRLLGEVGKLAREQFRATTLLEGLATTVEELADTWRAERDRREGEAAASRRALAEMEEQVRLGLVKDLLPVADALDASVRAARELLTGSHSPPPRRPSLVERLRGRPGGQAPVKGGGAALDSWLQGLLLIERRLHALLEREGVRPMAAMGRPFDPHRHLVVAVARTEGVPDGTVVGEELRGYTLGERVLRHAEVVVARGGSGPAGSSLGDAQ